MRKQMIGMGMLLLVFGLLFSACAAPAAAPAAEPEAAGEEAAADAEAAPAMDGTFTYWGGLIFSEEANQMLVDRIEQWGEERGVDVEVVMINQNETVQRVSAAVEAGTMPDALDIGRDLMLLLSQSDQLEPLDDLYATIGEAHGGWLPSADSNTNPDDFGGNATASPSLQAATCSIGVPMCWSLWATPKRRRPGKNWLKWRPQGRIRPNITAWALLSPTWATPT